MTGEVLAGRYRLERELGRGGMATVFLAMDERLSRPVALKRMHPGGGAGRAERFRREAELAASLKHPNVLEIHDYGEDETHGPFLVCEWVRGEDLRTLAGRLAPVPPEAAVVLAWELARALAAAHARGIVHRDVKPDNVLVAAGGPLKLADFGLAALEDQERLTSTGAVTGSLPYMAPERIDTGAFSPASDVYAVGIILFELLTGTTPHAGRGAAHLIAEVMTRDAPSLTERVPGVPAPLAALVARCLAREPGDRPENGAALDTELAELLTRLVGPPAEVAREFFLAPEACVTRWRRARFERLLEEGRGLLARGEGSRAARVLNAALALEPGSAEVMALLRERPRRRGWKAVAAGAALVAGVAVAWRPWESAPVRDASPTPVVVGGTPRVDVAGTSGGDGTALPRPVEVTGAPSGAATAIPAGSAASTTVPASERGPSPGGGRPPRSEPLSVEAKPPVRPSEPEPPRALPTVEPARHATLRVTARPWAEVFVNGESRGYTPRVRELSLPAGTYRLRFANPLCDAVEQEVTLAPGETVSRDVVLVVRKAELFIQAPEGARVFVDGRELGTAPLAGPVAVEHGRHTVTARQAGAPPLQREVDVVAGRRAEVALEVTP
ncbi:serine/threonine-protein kinase [Myxococcus sp. RHSTA-1-4]|uniref:serine/threonine-protein kinase n=1 Tax=Myxococcus sp. RHSTA-1-4 TaxID=2874601 RepID=UPI001CC14576|nr:serine/threonine-protein kinase [Myxococcus sp. RHSTA-1-4]MBZ4418879.1 protein kinase [Myxococcus sp. RHSTA-1-4]